MVKIKEAIKDRAIKKAKSQAICRYRISAIGINQRGEVVSTAVNRPRFDHKGGGLHAEMIVMLKSPPNLKSIIICRVGGKGNILPIHPCNKCQEKADELGVKIYSV